MVNWFPQMQPGGITGLVLATSDLESDYATLQAKGVKFRGPIESAPWGRFAVFSDPDGNGWVLQQGMMSRPKDS